MTLRFKNISHAYGNTQVLSDLNLEVKPGEITCLLGPSGGGKSTLLRLAAGLEAVQAGSIELGGELLASQSKMPPPEKRPVGMMFQENALFPHMSVRDNVAFGLPHLASADQNARVAELLAMVGLSNLADRYPHQLSGGQQQRIALIRSLAPEPSVLLMDEPYASIDITLRRELREAARQTIKRSGTTAIMVTHDPPEAMEMADVIAVLDAGKIAQVASPEDIYKHPADVSVAALFGDAQRIKAEFDGHKFVTAFGDISACGPVGDDLSPNQKCELVVRPRGLMVKNDHQAPLKVVDLRYVGKEWLMFLSVENTEASVQPLRIAVDSTEGFVVGDGVALSASASGFFVFAD